MSACATSSKTAGAASTPLFLGESPFSRMLTVVSFVTRWVRRETGELLSRRALRRLTIAETVSLGEKRFVSILCVDGEQFLLGGSPSNIVLLAKLDKADKGERAGTSGSFSELITELSCDRSPTVNSATCNPDRVAL